MKIYKKIIKFFNDIQVQENKWRVDNELKLDGLDPRSKMNTNTEEQPRNVEGYTLSQKELKVVTQCQKVCINLWQLYDIDIILNLKMEEGLF